MILNVLTFPQLVPIKEMNAVNVVTRDAKDQCRLLLGPVRAAGILRHSAAAIVVAQGSSSSSGCITTPAAAITVAQESTSSSGCITTPVAAIFVVTGSGTAVSTLPDSVVHTRTSGKAGKRRGGEKEEEEIRADLRR